MSTSISNFTIATLGSHTALQILKGAKDEGFRTLAIVTPQTRRVFESFPVADELIEISRFEDYFTIEDQLLAKNAIVIPHGSFVSYVGPENIKNMKAQYYGSKGILEWESDRTMEREWMKKAGLNLPKIYKKPEEIDRPVIIKFHGAKGGFGYFIANSPAEFYERIKEFPGQEDYAIQEYVVGVPMYAHYFYSALSGELEIMSFDKRYESNADSIGRIAAKDQLDANLRTSYTITGNIPIVVRESLLPMFFEIGESIVKQSKGLANCPKGLFGPFCLEGIIDPQLNYRVFEISARIVAGTNPYIEGSPYTAFRYKEPMSTGRRLAREIKQAIESGRLEDVLG
ncbi:5-formaminoimidazole-4-carboxamide-1-(beta)-D-ribofuranosyl 5'-monophosphate synthetase [Candidatus Peregrinibacteria bacterium RIFCSPLOWO2_02_FULL_48_14]|nr:MAG: 5-formaminoimidazole-4-carboxamide-1-(beta)-D-ribofuranosyl 5'-monophosphate synthetase [Candidatus Peregrinibacteria bacterium RIFCSPLOWO2_02_FULL_48_14]